MVAKQWWIAALAVLMAVPATGAARAGEDFPLVGTYVQNRPCKGDGTDAKPLLVTIGNAFHRMQREAHRLANLVQDLIDLSRLESDDPLAKAERVDLGEVVDEALGRAREVAAARAIELVGTTPEGLSVLGEMAEFGIVDCGRVEVGRHRGARQ